jgi:hypothetical protein
MRVSGLNNPEGGPCNRYEVASRAVLKVKNFWAK